MSNFKVGDRVSVYCGSRMIGTITAIDPSKSHWAGPICVETEKPKGAVFAHPKQCRKLRRRTRRKIWLNTDWVDGKNVGAICIAERGDKCSTRGMTQFIEVRKKDKP